MAFNRIFFFLFYFWLRWVLVAARRIFIVVHRLLSSCSMCLQSHRLYSLRHVGSVVVARGLSCPVACRIPTRDRTHVPCIGRRILNHWSTREVPNWLLKASIICCPESRESKLRNSLHQVSPAVPRKIGMYSVGFL